MVRLVVLQRLVVGQVHFHVLIQHFEQDSVAVARSSVTVIVFAIEFVGWQEINLIFLKSNQNIFLILLIVQAEEVA